MRKYVAALMMAALMASFAAAQAVADEAQSADEAFMVVRGKLEKLDESSDTFQADAQDAALACREFLLAHPDHEVAMQLFQIHDRLLGSAGLSEEESQAISDSFRKQSEGTGLAALFDLVDLFENLPEGSELPELYAGMEKLAAKHPNSGLLVGQLAQYVVYLDIDGAEKAAKVDALLASKALSDGDRSNLQGWKDRNSKIGTPVSFQFTNLDGEAVDTADWKGKVILVDFWATWCGPCVAELPRMLELYEEYHPKGLEVVGISCDKSSEPLKKFVEARGIPWTQWPPMDDSGWHPEANKWSIRGIPTMFLIDKKGVLRSVEARGELETLIPELIAEEM